MKIQDFKMRVNPEQSKIVQDTLFENEHSWRWGYTKITHINDKFLFLEDGELTCIPGGGKQDDIYFNSIQLSEITFEEFKEKYIK